MIENTLRLINHNNNILLLCGLPKNFKKIIAGKIDEFTFTVSSDMEYAPYVEFGTSKAPPYPYFRPNIERLKEAAKGAIV